MTELQGTGGQFSSTQRGQSRGHWPFPPFLSLCPLPPVTLSHSLMLTHFVLHLLQTSSCHFLLHSTSLSWVFLHCFPTYICWVNEHFELFIPPFKPAEILFTPNFPPLSHITLLSNSITSPFSSHLPHSAKSSQWSGVHRIVMWGAAVLLTKHKAFHIQPAPGILGCYSLCVCVCVRVCVCVCVLENDSGRETNRQRKMGGVTG